METPLEQGVTLIQMCDKLEMRIGGISMKKLIRQLIKYGPVIYPVIKKYLNKRKAKKNYREE
ncbi:MULTISPECIES: hypothetical protein [Clostridia]|uniref:hypothetical protein n=1 Tax=Clostridia TaxID=186801 RepID=UPI000EA106D0|nr:MULTISPECIES: hypothetical protein [Clostridia]NBJ69853.1 hypothetical protein [Roseburia sp. 1XD42-34]